MYKNLFIDVVIYWLMLILFKDFGKVLYIIDLSVFVYKIN